MYKEYVFRRKTFSLSKFFSVIVIAACIIIIDTFTDQPPEHAHQEAVQEPFHMSTVFIAGTILFLFLILKWLYGFFTEITINESGITCKLPSGEKYFYAWNEIHSVGMYVKTRLSFRDLAPSDYDEDFLLRDKCVWLALPADFTRPNQLRLSADYLDFYYDEDAWELICHYRSKSHGK